MKNKLKSYYVFSCLVFLILIVGCSSSSSVTDIKEMSAADLKAEMKTNSNLVVLDVRHPEELTGEHGQIEGVLNIPVEELEDRITELNKYKNNKIAVICRSGNRSSKAAALLTNSGFDVYNVTGGMKAYNKLDD